LTNPIQFNMNVDEKNIMNLQDKFWYIIKYDEESNNGAQNLNTNTTNDFVYN